MYSHDFCQKNLRLVSAHLGGFAWNDPAASKCLTRRVPAFCDVLALSLSSTFKFETDHENLGSLLASGKLSARRCQQKSCARWHTFGLYSTNVSRRRKTTACKAASPACAPRAGREHAALLGLQGRDAASDVTRFLLKAILPPILFANRPKQPLPAFASGCWHSSLCVLVFGGGEVCSGRLVFLR